MSSLQSKRHIITGFIYLKMHEYTTGPRQSSQDFPQLHLWQCLFCPLENIISTYNLIISMFIDSDVLCETSMEIDRYSQMKTSRDNKVPGQTITWPGHQQFIKSSGQLAFFYPDSFLRHEDLCLDTGNKTSFGEIMEAPKPHLNIKWRRRHSR